MSLIAPFFHQNLPEIGMDRNEYEKMIADGCNFMSMPRTHVMTSCSIIGDLAVSDCFSTNKVLQGCKFPEKLAFFKRSMTLKQEIVCWKWLFGIHVLTSVFHII